MDIVLGIVRYLFVGTIFVGGGMVLRAIVLLAIQKSRPVPSGEQQ
jgi:hypothetical protein